jgi:hypothetical protein
MKTINLNMNMNLTLNLVNITLCNVRPKEGFDIFLDKFVS